MDAIGRNSQQIAQLGPAGVAHGIDRAIVDVGEEVVDHSRPVAELHALEPEFRPDVVSVASPRMAARNLAMRGLRIDLAIGMGAAAGQAGNSLRPAGGLRYRRRSRGRMYRRAMLGKPRATCSAGEVTSFR